MNNNRNSSIELMKVIAIILIIISHTTIKYVGKGSMYYCDLNCATNDVNVLINIIFQHFGMLGDTVFFFCSAWFLCDDNRIKPNKPIKIAADNYFFCILITIVILILGFSVGKKDILNQIIPLTSNINWFVPSYIILYLIHPLLNKAVSSLSKKQMALFTFAFLGYFTIKNIIFPTIDQFYTRLLGSILIYFMAIYIKRYGLKYVKNIKINVALFIMGIILFVSRGILLNYLGLRIESLSDDMLRFDTFTDILDLMIVIPGFCLLSQKNFSSKLINHFSSLSLLIYVIHGNYLIKHNLYRIYYEKVFSIKNNNSILLFQAILVITVLIGTVIVAEIYELSVGKLINKALTKISGHNKEFSNGSV